MPRNINVCGCRDRYKAPVSVTYRFGKDGKGNPTPQSIVLWRCRKCRAVRSQVVTGTWTLAEINGQAAPAAVALAAEEAAQQMITDQLATEALEMVTPSVSASPTVAIDRIMALGKPRYGVDYEAPVLPDLTETEIDRFIGAIEEEEPDKQEAIQHVWGKLDEFSYLPPRDPASNPYPDVPPEIVYALNSQAERKAAQLPKRVPGSGPKYPIGDSPA